MHIRDIAPLDLELKLSNVLLGGHHLWKQALLCNPHLEVLLFCRPLYQYWLFVATQMQVSSNDKTSQLCCLVCYSAQFSAQDRGSSYDRDNIGMLTDESKVTCDLILVSHPLFNLVRLDRSRL